MMRRYEGMFIIKPDMNKEELKKTLDSIEDTIAKNGGRIEKCQRWAGRRLGYTVKKFEEGEYYLCDFEAEPKTVSALEGAYRLNDNILRTLITVKGR